MLTYKCICDKPGKIHPQCKAETHEPAVEVWKCGLDKASYFSENFGDVMDEIKEAEPGEIYTIQKVAMSREQFDSLPEFSGF